MMRPALSPSRSPSCSPSCKQQLRGFTVLEASISLIIAEIIFFTAVATWALIVPALRRNATVAEESARAGLITERITLDIQNAGGGGIPPHNAIVVEKACAARTRSGTNYLPACPVGDRITVANAVAGPSTCRVSAQISDTRLEFFDLNNVCCFPDVGGADPFLRHVMLRDDDTYELAYLRATGSDCLFDVTPLRDSLSQASSLPSLQWQDAVLVDVKSYMLDTQAGAKDPRLHQLIVHIDIDGDPTTF